MDTTNFLKKTLTDIKVDISQDFDRNFQRKAFFNKKWPSTRAANTRGSLMMRSGKLRRSVKSRQTTKSIVWSSSMPYAAINNEGGEITVTAKMKSFFWAMYYKATGAVTKTKTGKTSKSKRNIKLSGEAQMWRNMALMKVGSKIKIPQRQFIGHHRKVHNKTLEIIAHNFEEISYEFGKHLQKNIK